MQAVSVTRCQPQLAGRPTAAHRRSVLPAGLPLRGLQRAARPLPPCKAMDDSDAEDDVQQQRQQQRQAVQQAAPAQEEQQQEREAAVAASSTAAAAGAGSEPQRQQRAAVAAPAPPPAAAEPDMGQAWKMGLGGVVALAAFAGLGFLGHRLFKSKAVSSAVTNVQQSIQRGQLQKESRARLDGFMSTLRNMQTADISAQNLGDEGFAYVVDALSFNDRCAAADFSKNGVGAEGCKQLVQALTSNSGLQSLLLDTNALGDEGAAMLATALAGGSRITTLNLSSNNIGDAGAKALAEMLKTNTTLEVLELNGNVIDYEGIGAIAEALTVNTSLKTLGLSDNYIQTPGAALLAAALKQNSTLQELYIKGNELGDEGVKTLCEALKGHKELKAVDFGNNSMGKEGAAALADLLRGSQTITDVNINMNDVGNDGAFQIAAAISGSKTLKLLDVGGNNISEDGAKALASALKGNESLRTLELSYNPIGADGAKAFADVVKYDMQVESVGMGWCKIGAGEGAKAVADMLMYNNSIRRLDLRGNAFGNDGAIWFSRGFKEHTNGNLTELELGYNEIKDEGACALAQALKANPEGAPKEFKINANYLTKFGQVALTEALDMVFDMAKKEIRNLMHELQQCWWWWLSIAGGRWARKGGPFATQQHLRSPAPTGNLFVTGRGPDHATGERGSVHKYRRDMQPPPPPGLAQPPGGGSGGDRSERRRSQGQQHGTPGGPPSSSQKRHGKAKAACGQPEHQNQPQQTPGRGAPAGMPPPPPPPAAFASYVQGQQYGYGPQYSSGPPPPSPYYGSGTPGRGGRGGRGRPSGPSGCGNSGYTPGGYGSPAPPGGYTPPPPPPGSASHGGRGGRGGRGAAGGGRIGTPMGGARPPPPPPGRRGSSGSSYGTPPPARTPMHGSSSASSVDSARRTSGRRGSYFAEHLPGDVLQQGLKGGALFRAVFRTNPSDRNQGFCSLPGLPTDVFVRGFKLQNRAIEGDEVAIRILPPTEWYQLASAKAAAEAEVAKAAAGGATAAAQAAPGCSNVVPAALPSRAAAATAPPPTPLTTAVGAAPAAMTPPAWANGQQRRPTGDLVASPALLPSASGGDLGVALGPSLLGDADASEESEAGSVSSEGSLSLEEHEALVAAAEEDLVGLKLDTDIAALMAADEEEASVAAGEAASTPPAAQQAQQAQQAEEEDSTAHCGAQQAQQAQQADEEEPESMVDFLLRRQMSPASPDGSASSAGAAGAAGMPDVPAPSAWNTVGPLRCWHPVGSDEAAVAQIARRLAAMEGWRVTGEVVAVLEPSRRRESVVGVLKQEGEKDTGTFFLVPCDPRLPRMMVRSAGLPPAIKQALKTEAQTAQLAARTLVSARVAAWEAQFPFPLAQVRSSLGQAGDLATETAALLSMEQVQDDDQFTPEVLACLPPTPWSISAEELAKRRDFRQHRVFSIDPPTARDLDDALSVKPLPGGGYRVGVHIADVSHFVQPGSALDKEAQQRSTSVYLVDRVIPMLPRLLCEELCSLNPGVDRLAFSVVWDMDAEGNIESTWAGRSVIRSCGKLAYPHVQSMIEGSYLALEGQEPPCELSGGHSWPEVVQDSLTLHRIASALRQRRFDGGALRLDNTRLFFKLDGEGNPCDYGVYEQKEANQLVEEFMLLANMTTARMVAEAWPDRALLRCHPPPNMHKMTELSTTAAELGFELDTSGAGPLQRSLSALRSNPSTDPAMLEVLTLLATKPMQNARYFCTGETPDASFWRHFALAVSHYTHFTSPIRRYPDIIVHRLMAALLDERGGEAERISRHGLFPPRQVGEIAAHANDRKLAAKSVQDGSLRLYLCVMLHRAPLVCDAVVMQLGGSRFFDCYIPALGCDVRIHTDALLRGGAAAVDSQWHPEDKVLTLAHATPEDQRGEQDQPDYSDVPNLASLRNPAGVAPAALPLTLRMLCHVPILVSSRRSQTSGSPTHVTAKLWLQPLPAELAAAAAGPGGGSGGPGTAAEDASSLREARAPGIQENWD